MMDMGHHMRLPNALILAVLLSLLAGGCLVERVVEVDVATAIATSASNGLTATDAKEIFRNVADQLGLVVEGPVPQPRGAHSIQYVTRRSNRSNKCRAVFSLFISGKYIIFYSYSVSTNYSEARRYAALYERELDKRGIHYQVTQRAKIPW
jgi:hypothetical protein